MHENSTRRDFLWQNTALLAGLACSSPLTRLSAAEPIVRPGTPKFKFSLAAYSYRDLLKKQTVTLDDFIDDCAKFGCEGTELTSYYFPEAVTDAALIQTRARCFRLGLDVSGTAVGNNFGLPVGMTRDQQVANVKTWIDRAVVLGAPVIRVFAGQIGKGQEEAATLRLMIEGLEDVCAYAGKRGVHLALENHGGPTATAEGLLQLVKSVKSPWLGVNMDTGNFHSTDVYAEMAQVAPYALNVQVKVVTSGSDKQKVPTDYKRINQLLRTSGYRGYVVLEYEEAGNPREECPRHLDQLREALKE